MSSPPIWIQSANGHHVQFAAVAPKRNRQQHRDDESQPGCRARQRADGFLAHFPAKDEVDQQAQNRQEDDQGDQGEQVLHGLSFQAAHLVHVDAVLGAENRHDQCQADRHFRRRDRHDEEDE